MDSRARRRPVTITPKPSLGFIKAPLSAPEVAMPHRGYLPWLLATIFFLALFMGTGPGMLLANEPKTWFGFPRLYIWALFWCFVEAAVVVVAYFFVWHPPADERDGD